MAKAGTPNGRLHFGLQAYLRLSAVSDHLKGVTISQNLDGNVLTMVIMIQKGSVQHANHSRQERML